VPGARALVAAVLAAAVVVSALPALRTSPALGATAACTPGAWPAANASLATQVVALENQYRASLGLGALTVDSTLTDSATWKARHMAQYGYFAHDDPAPPVARSAYQRALDCGYTTNASWGENIALGQPTPSAVMAAWIASPPHQANLSDPSFQAIGVSAAADASGHIYWVQDFGSVVVAGGTTPPTPPAAPPAPPVSPPTPPPALPAPPPVTSPIPVAPPVSVSPPAVTPTPVTSAVTPPVDTAPQIGSAITPQSSKGTARGSHAARLTRLLAAKPRAGDAYSVRLSFGRVPVSTSALALHCKARLAGRQIPGTGAIAGHVATCSWQIPAKTHGRRLVVRVKVSGRRGVSLVRSARLLVA
jgi:uncharacterized protein YkwD